MPGRVGTVNVACLAVALVCAVGTAQEPGLPDGVSAAIDAGEWERVAELLEPNLGPDSTEAVSYWYGVTQLELGRPDAAMAHLRRAAEANPHSLACARSLARCAASLQDTDTLDALVESFPIDAEILLHAGKAWMAKYYPAKREAEAKFDYLAAEPMTYRKNAQRHLALAAAIANESAEAHRWYARALFEAGAAGQALDEVRAAISLAPLGWESHVLMADCLVWLGARADAAAALEFAVALAPHKRADLEFRRGRMLIRAGEFAEAVAAFRTVMQLDVRYPAVRYWLGRAAFNAGDYRLALWAFADARRVEPPPAERMLSEQVDPMVGPVFWAGRCAYELGNYRDAERLFVQARDEAGSYFFERRPLWRHYLGRAQWKLRKYDEAMENLQAALDADPEDLIYARWVFQGHLERGDPYAAIEICTGLATRGYPEVAAEGIKAVMRRWPKPRMEDLRAGHPNPHTIVAAEALTRIEYEAGHYRTAAMMFRAGGRHRGRRTHPQAGWAMIAANDLAGASTAFEDFARYAREQWVDYGRLGQACALLLRGDAEQALDRLAEVEHPVLATPRDTVAVWAKTALHDPSARALADTLTLLGAIGWEVDEEAPGMKIRAVIPGSLLDQAAIDLRPSDRLVAVGSDEIRDRRWLEILRRGEVPDGPVEVVIGRGKETFAVTVDYANALAKIAAPESRADDEETP